MQFLRKIKNDKIEILYNENPIEMKSFLSFLTIETRRPKGDWPGKCDGWTKICGDGELYITGGIIGGVEYLNHILYGKNLENQYNNYVTPFSLFDIMTKEGKLFFLGYYADDIKSILSELKAHASRATEKYNETLKFWEEISTGNTIRNPTNNEVNK